jgi:predicted RNA binding protein YcfA (HicA-like mRNA interferase family)
MPKLPSLTPQKVIKILEKKGFILDRTKGSHHIYYHPETRRRVVVPFHKRDLPKGTLLEILRQAGISREEVGIDLGSERKASN